MRRIRGALTLDLRLIARYNIVFAAAFITVFWLIVLQLIPPRFYPRGVPLLIFIDLASFGFFFMAGLILFEQNERVLRALIVSPLRFYEYLTAKLLALILVSLAVSLAIALGARGLRFNPWLLLGGAALAAAMTLTLAVVAVAPFRSVSAFLFPSIPYMLLSAVPLIQLAERVGPSWLAWVWRLWPTGGALVWLMGSTTAVPPWEITTGGLAQLAWLLIAARWARRRFERHVLRRGA